jgi:hypothetical protein
MIEDAFHAGNPGNNYINPPPFPSPPVECYGYEYSPGLELRSIERMKRVAYYTAQNRGILVQPNDQASKDKGGAVSRV